MIGEGEAWRAALHYAEEIPEEFIEYAEQHLGWSSNAALATASALGVLSVFANWAAAAWLLAPWIAAGETRWRAIMRAAKLILWTAPALWLAAIMVEFVPRLAEESSLGDELATGLWLTAALWWGSALLRLGDRYAGPTTGPLYEPRELRCETCGYALTHLSLASRCPECGRPIAESLPSRRTPPPYATARNILTRFVDLLATILRTLRPRRFGERLAVYNGREQARRFAMSVGLLAVVPAALFVATHLLDSVVEVEYECGYGDVVFGARSVLHDRPPPGWPGPVSQFASIDFDPPDLPSLFRRTAAGGVGVVLAYAGQSIAWFWLMLLAAAQLFTLGGFVQTERRITVLCYASAWLLVPISGVFFAFVGADWMREAFADDPLAVVLEFSWGAIRVYQAVELLPSAVAAVGLAWFPFHFWRMLAATRYANA